MRATSVFLTAIVLGLIAMPGTGPALAKETKGDKAPRYPASFRVAVKKAIEQGVTWIKSKQSEGGTWGDPKAPEGMGLTALPLLTLLKGGVSADDPAVEKAFKQLESMPFTRVYSAGCYLMALHAKYQPHVDTMDTHLGEERRKRLRPEDIAEGLSELDRKRIDEGLAFLEKSQNSQGLWRYTIPPNPVDDADYYDISTTQYALLGLRAVMDCGITVKPRVWKDAIRGLFLKQDPEGERFKLETREVRDGYVYHHKENAEARGFRYRDQKKHGPLGENTIPIHEPTGSMTTAGVACVLIAQEGLWRSRRFGGKDRRLARAAVRDGMAWMTKHFAVESNPGREDNHYHYYYLYGLERMGMLAGRRWLGEHDWYKTGADFLIAKQGKRGAWSNVNSTSFAVLFLKRATSPSDTVVVTGR